MKNDTTTPLQWVTIDKAIPRLEDGKFYPVLRKDGTNNFASGTNIKAHQNNFKEVIIPIGDEEIIILGDKVLSEIKENKNHITTQLSENENISYNTGFHTGFVNGFKKFIQPKKETPKKQLSDITDEDKPKWKTCKNCDCGEFPRRRCDCSCHD